MKLLRTLALLLAGALCLLLVVVAVNAVRAASAQPAGRAQAVEPAHADALQRLSGALKFRTVSVAEDAEANADEFRAFHAYLERSFPRVHAQLRREQFGRSLLFTWAGSDAALKPALWSAHQDVVPVSADSRARWTHDPFSGEVTGGFVWGRGAWDNKGSLLAQLEAVERLLAQGWAPRRTLLLAFGHDEETGGEHGAGSIAAALKARGARLDYVLDEGLVVTQGVLKAIARPVAMVGIAEKGYASVRISVEGASGHSSVPPARTSIDVLARAVGRINDSTVPAKLEGVAREMMVALGPELPLAQRALMSNLWLFDGLVASQLAKAPLTNAMLRTTTATTLFHAGDKENVLPGNAQAVINARLLPGDSPQKLMERLRKAVADEGIRLELLPGSLSDPSAVSSTSTPAYRAIEQSVRDVFADVVVAPALVMGGTDSKHYAAIADAVYRFQPVHVMAGDVARYHGIDERVSSVNYAQMIAFYEKVLRNEQAGSLH